MSDCLDPAPLAALTPSTDARAARLAKFEREQLIVNYLNRGVSVAEIAARVGVGEKRMRASIKEILARRMPAPPAEFVAIQVSRLNEALLVAYSAMGPTNLKAVDRVVRIVRELDRYPGFDAAAGRRRAEPERLGPAAEGTARWSEALIRRAQISPQGIEEIECSTGIAMAPDAAAPRAFSVNRDRHCERRSDQANHGSQPAARSAGSTPREQDPVVAVLSEREPTPCAADRRPPIPPQEPEKIESAPEPSPAGEATVRGKTVREEAPDSRTEAVPEASPGIKTRCGTADTRPHIPRQPVENIDSAPGTGGALDAAPAPADDSPMVLTPTGWRRASIRLTLNGVAAC